MHLGGVTLLLEGTLRAPHLTASFGRKRKEPLSFERKGVWLFSGKYCCWLTKLLPDLPRSDSTEADTKEILNETAAIFD